MGAPQDSQKQQGGQDPQQLREGQQKPTSDGQQQQPEQGGQDGPRQRGETSPEGGEADTPKRDDGMSDTWLARLPAEVREALAGGQWDKIPARYRKLIERYTLWMQKNKAEQAGSGR